jgi:hypothetical protein
VGLPDLLYRLLIIRVNPLSHARSLLHPVWDGADWRTKHLATADSMMTFLMHHCLPRQALAEAERAYGQFQRKSSEGAVELLLRLRVVYNTASLAADFTRRIPEQTLPEMLVRGLDTDLHYRVVDGLKKGFVIWSRDKLDKYDRTSPESITKTLLKIQQEIDTQLHLTTRTPRSPAAGVSFQRPGSQRAAIPYGRRPASPGQPRTAYAAQVRDGSPASPGDGQQSLRAVRTRSPPPPRGPIGKLGPPVPHASRPPPQTRGGPPKPDESRQGRFTLGHDNYGGCHNCGSKEHMARECTRPPSERIAALISQDCDWTPDDGEAILEQGMPECMQEHWQDTEAVYDYCAQLTGQQPNVDDDASSERSDDVASWGPS